MDEKEKKRARLGKGTKVNVLIYSFFRHLIKQWDAAGIDLWTKLVIAGFIKKERKEKDIIIFVLMQNIKMEKLIRALVLVFEKCIFKR